MTKLFGLKYFTLFICTCLTTAAVSQADIRNLLRDATDFESTVKLAEDYFKRKHPDLSAKELSSGEYRDGDFVKYMRWKRFWQQHLGADKKAFGDIPQRIKESKTKARNGTNPYNDIPWTNISYENYIVGQIGLGRTTSIGFHPTDPDIFYVGAAIGGIWKTEDGGQSYSPLGDELPFMAVSSIVVDKSNPQIIYIAISDHVWYGPPGIGIYKSIDGGQSWNPTSLSFNFTDNIQLYWLEASLLDPQTLFVATTAGLYRTTDGFTTSQKVNSTGFFDVKIHPTKSTIIYAGSTNGNVFVSTNGGQSFSLSKNLGSGSVLLGTTVASPDRVYARQGATLHKSYDQASSFPETNSFAENNEVFVVSPSNASIIVSGNFESYQSDNNGVSFSKTMSWLGDNGLPEVHVDQRNVFTNPLENDKVYFCNDGGVYRYTMSTKSFENLSDGLKITQYYDIATAQTDPLIVGGGSQDNGSMFRESTGIWDDYAPTGDGMNQDIDPTDENTRYWAYQNGDLYRWVNGVNTSISPPGQNGNGAWQTPYRLDETNPSRIIAGYNQVYESLDKGNSWASISPTLTSSDLQEIAISKSNPARVYATFDNQLFVKSVSNNTWTTKTMPSGGIISDLEVDPLDMDKLYISVPGYSAGFKVYMSPDAGDNWLNISGTLPNVSTGAIELYHDVPEAIFVGTDIGVFYRDENTSDWLEYGNLPHTRVEDIEIQYQTKTIRIGTHGRGIFEASIDIKTCTALDSDADDDGVCDSFDVCPNFDDSLLGQTCDDGDPMTSGETFAADCTCSGGYSNIQYCPAEGSAGTGADWIKRVQLNTLDNLSTQSAYSDFRTQRTVLNKEKIYTLTINMNYSFPLDEVYAWIDFDRNGNFDPTESIALPAINSSNHMSEGSFSIPSTVDIGITTMRVRVIYADPNNPEPCNSFFGEVEDYTIEISCEENFEGVNQLSGTLSGTESYETDGNISSSQKIATNANIIYDSGESIELLSPFEVKSSSTFHAYIDGCGGI